MEQELYCLRSDDGLLPDGWQCEEWKPATSQNDVGWWVVRTRLHERYTRQVVHC